MQHLIYDSDYRHLKWPGTFLFQGILNYGTGAKSTRKMGSIRLNFCFHTPFLRAWIAGFNLCRLMLGPLLLGRMIQLTREVYLGDIN